MIYIASRHTPIEKIQKKYPKATIVDLTSRGEQPYVRFSPFYPLGDIPVPFSEGVFSQSVEGLWQGLKVFESCDVDLTRLEVTDMKGLKRTVRKYGKCLGHRKGIGTTELLGYIEARKSIYLPAYRWALENKLQTEVQALRLLAAQQDLVLLDYETNGDVEFRDKPLSHAWLVKYFLEDKYPVLGTEC